MTPDDEDPPELQFYRTRPFFVGGSGRLAAHVLQYAPSPSQRILGTEYGRHPAMCIGTSGDQCHGPHMCTSPQLRTTCSAHTVVSLRADEEWWVGPASGDAADTTGWRRPYRRTHAAPHDAVFGHAFSICRAVRLANPKSITTAVLDGATRCRRR